MRIAVCRPPNFDEIVERLPSARREGVIFTYDDVIYNPSGGDISPQLMIHEGVHARQQRGLGVENWWEQYLSTPGFRYEQELVAHQAEWLAWKDYPRARRRVALKHIAKRLSSPLYGRMVTFDEAKKRLKTAGA